MFVMWAAIMLLLFVPRVQWVRPTRTWHRMFLCLWWRWSVGTQWLLSHNKPVI